MIAVVAGKLSTGQDGIVIYLESQEEPICEFATVGASDQTLLALRIVELLHQLGLDVVIDVSPEVDAILRQIGNG
jgi:hypothetical protein